MGISPQGIGSTTLIDLTYDMVLAKRLIIMFGRAAAAFTRNTASGMQTSLKKKI
jgi:hypothetical protein